MRQDKVMQLKRASVVGKKFDLTLMGPRGQERLKIMSEYPDFLLAQDLFQGLGTMHLVAPYFPKKIATNFRVVQEIRQLIHEMYDSENKTAFQFAWLDGKPYSMGEIELEERAFTPARQRTRFNKRTQQFPFPTKNPKRVAVAYSAGKDSMWNMWWAQEKYGADNVLCVHVNGLNRGTASLERTHTERQVKALGFKHFRMITLHNGSKNTGYTVMRSRDMFLAGLIVPVALEFGASEIITEGFAEEKPNEPFTGLARNMIFFNDNVLGALGIPIRVTWRNRLEMDVVKDLFKNRPEWFPYVCNCFSVPRYHANIRKGWKKRTPSLRLYDSQCGSCIKCRITNLGRILYAPNADSVREDDARKFLKHTARWIQEKRMLGTHTDMIEGSFMRDFLRASQRYGLINPSAT